MELRIKLTPEQETFIRESIASGRFQSAEDAAQEALRLWEERERRRSELIAELDAAEASLARGHGRHLTPQSIDLLLDGVKRQGRSRLDPTR